MIDCYLLPCPFISKGNPLEEKHSTEGDWRDMATTKLPKLKKLDGTCVFNKLFITLN